MQVNHQKQIVEVWMTHQEQQDAALMEGLQAHYQQYKEKKYKVAVFCSGEQDLISLTEELLLHNRMVAACKDLEQEQATGMTMGM